MPKAQIYIRSYPKQIPNNPDALMAFIDSLQGMVLEDSEGKKGTVVDVVTVLNPIPIGPKGLLVIAVVRVAVPDPVGGLVLPR